MKYAELAPNPHLASIVHCLWTLEGDAAELGGEAQPILPDGRPELVLHVGDAFERVYGDGRIERQPGLLFAGQLTSALVLRPTGRIGVLGVRLHPHGAAALLEQPQDELAGLTIGVDDLSPALARSLHRVRDSATTLTATARAAEACLADHVNRSRVDVRVESTVETIRRHRGRVTVEQLAHRVGLTRRHLERRFNAIVGLSPKRLARITRFQHALHVLERADGLGGADTAALCGYADQAHFVRECRELTGRPPTAHLLQRAQLTGFFVE